MESSMWYYFAYGVHTKRRFLIPEYMHLPRSGFMLGRSCLILEIQGFFQYVVIKRSSERPAGSKHVKTDRQEIGCSLSRC